MTEEQEEPKVGRPLKTLTPDQIEQLPKLAAYLNTEQIADILGINRDTFFEMRKRDESIDLAYRQGKAKAVGSIAKNLITQAMNGNTQATIFYLKCQAGWKEPEENKSEVSVNNIVIDPDKYAEVRNQMIDENDC